MAAQYATRQGGPINPRSLPDQNTAPASHGREALLEAVTACISGILGAESLREALPRELQSIGRLVRLDRLVIIEWCSNGDNTNLTPQIFFVWNSADAPQLDAGAIIEKSHGREAMEEWLSPLRQGQPVSLVRRLVTGPMHELLTQLQVVSTLQVPMMLNGMPCGVLVFDDCRGEHEWSAARISILKLLADFIGTVVTRESASEALRYRDEILAAVNASVVHLMAASDLNAVLPPSLISRSWPRVWRPRISARPWFAWDRRPRARVSISVGQ